MQVVSRYPDRVKALGSVLSVENGADMERLVWWAIYQLTELRNPAADSELKRFETEIRGLPNSAPQKQRLRFFEQAIRQSAP